jgi:hypothetical protein
MVQGGEKTTKKKTLPTSSSENSGLFCLVVDFCCVVFFFFLFIMYCLLVFENPSPSFHFPSLCLRDLFLLLFFIVMVIPSDSNIRHLIFRVNMLSRKKNKDYNLRIRKKMLSQQLQQKYKRQ